MPVSRGARAEFKPVVFHRVQHGDIVRSIETNEAVPTLYLGQLVVSVTDGGGSGQVTTCPLCETLMSGWSSEGDR